VMSARWYTALIIVIGIVLSIVYLSLSLSLSLSQSRSIITESFDGNMTLKDIPEASYKRANGIESCEILKTNNESIGNAEYGMMERMLGGFRLNKWKPVDDNKKKSNREYCYMYDDRVNNISDYMSSGVGVCDLSNPLFRDNPMITNVFIDETEDKTHVLPLRKCVIELDANMVRPESINRFWSQWGSESTHCDHLTGDLRGELSNVRVTYQDVHGRYTRLVGADQVLSARNGVLLSDLGSCGACNNTWSQVIDSQWSAITEEESALTSEQRLFTAYTQSNAGLRNQTAEKRAERDSWRELWGSQSNVYYPCSGSLSECQIQESQAASNYQAVLTLNRGLTACNQSLTGLRDWYMNGFNSLNESLTVCEGVRAEETDRKTAKYNDLTALRDWYHSCDLERGHYYNAFGTYSNLYLDNLTQYNGCVGDRNSLNSNLSLTRRNKLDCESSRGGVEQQNIHVQREMTKKEQELEQAKADLRKARDEYLQCINRREKLTSMKNNLMQNNVELYNELERAFQRMKNAQKAAFEDQRYAIEESLLNIGKGCEANAAEIGDLQTQVQILMELPEKKEEENVCGNCIVSQEQCAIYEKEATFCMTPTDYGMIDEADAKDGVPK
jgi:hypothetical protein